MNSLESEEATPLVDATGLTSAISISASFVFRSRVLKGNTTVQVHSRRVNTSIRSYRLVSEEHPPWDYNWNILLTFVCYSRTNSLTMSIWMTLEVPWERRTSIIRAQLKFEFFGAKTVLFKPGMPYDGHVYVMYDDNQALSPEKLAGANMIIRPVVTTSNGQLKTLAEVIVPAKGEYLSNSKGSNKKKYGADFKHWMERQVEDAEFGQFRRTGVFRFRFSVPKFSNAIKMTATYKDEEGDKATAEMRAVAFYSSNAGQMKCTSTSGLARNKDDWARMPLFICVVVSKGLVIHGATETHPHPTKLVTFSVPVSSEMAPTFKLVAMVVSPIGELVADSVTISCEIIPRRRSNWSANWSLTTITRPGAFVGVSLLRTINYIFQTDNTLTPSRVIKALYNLEPFTRSVHGVTWRDNPGADTKRTLDLAGLLLFTDAKISQYPDIANCDQSNEYEPCLAVGCFHKDQRCPPVVDDKMSFRILRRSRYHDFYDWLDGDWAWYDIPTTDDGIEFYDRGIAATDETWLINVFSFHLELGFSMMDEVVAVSVISVRWDGSPSFYFSVESPISAIRRGETLGVRLMAVNNLKDGVDRFGSFRRLPFRQNVYDGEVEPSGTLQTNTSWRKASTHGCREGAILSRSLCITGGTRHHKFEDSNHQSDKTAEGATVTRYTSLLLYLKNKASVTLCGNVFGPVFPSTPISTDSLLSHYTERKPICTIWPALCGVYTFSIRLMNQLKSRVFYRGLNTMNVQMAERLSLYKQFSINTNLYILYMLHVTIGLIE
uniref:Alpha-2-macroglobulin bait region domain-containing protein n=1 Tax=Daphnia galeata TaxID=27404 RepID=A0A8J2WGF2_9CRUS|nr:unnamed protein product [Daphnia galeata]